MTNSKKHLFHGLICTGVMMTSISLVAGNVMESFSSTLDAKLGTKSSILVSNDGDSLYQSYTPPSEYLNEDGSGNSVALAKKGIILDRELVREGSVLLKNEENSLPLRKGNKITLFGVRSQSTLLGANVGGMISGGIIPLESALSDSETHFDLADYRWGGSKTLTNFKFEEVGGEGAGFEVNPTMSAIYKTLASKHSATVADPASDSNYDSKEASLAEVAATDPNYASSFASYSDAAIVVISRGGGEGHDYAIGGTATGAEPLALSQNEKETIALAKTCSSNVIVLVNSSNPIEIDELKNDKDIKSILWIGYPGNFGTLGIADLLSGKYSPSGGLSDTYAAKNLSNPAMVNFGNFQYANSEVITDRSNSYSGADNYLVEAEGLYTGYRYYETRYYDAVLKQGNASSMAGVYNSSSTWNYDEEVTYSFGYGLTYSEIEETITDFSLVKENGGTYAKVTVNVENKGDFDTKANVQLYAQAPYIHGQTKIEKSAIQLLDFDKTDIIKAKSSQAVTLKADLSNLASYDSTLDNGDGTKGSYVFELGDYYFAVGNGVHEALDNILAQQGYTKSNTSDRMSADGNKNAAYKFEATATEVSTDAFATSRNGIKISNQLEYSDWNYYEKDKVTYLSRSDWEATYPKKYENMTIPASMIDDLNGRYYTVKTDEDTSSVKWGSTATDHKFYNFSGYEYSAPEWDELVSQMSLDESLVLSIFGGGPTFPQIESVGLQEETLAENAGNGISLDLAGAIDTNAPWKIDGTTDNNRKWSGEILPCSPLIASTFSPALIKEEGDYVGVQSLFYGLAFLWGPGLNTHRTPYNGRNEEYYSEDPVLSGISAMEFAMGAMSHGLIVTPKHFAFNDQETNRKSVAPFMTEQRAREIELRAYQIAIEANKYDEYELGVKTKDVGMLGLMISFSKIGGVECSCSHGLLTSILKEEWGFHGYAVTDIQDDLDIVSSELYAGITGVDIRGPANISSASFATYISAQADGTTISADLYKNDLSIQKALKQSNKDLLYALSRSNVINRYNASTRKVWNMTWWRGAYFGATAVFGLASVAGLVFYILICRKEKN